MTTYIHGGVRRSPDLVEAVGGGQDKLLRGVKGEEEEQTYFRVNQSTSTVMVSIM